MQKRDFGHPQLQLPALLYILQWYYTSDFSILYDFVLFVYLKKILLCNLNLS